ncbi:MAG: hypothetical protein ACRD1R_08065 [Acidobacteriota bacterium]
MALSDLIRSGVDLAFNLLGESLPTITHEVHTGFDANDNRAYGAGVARKALIKHKHEWVQANALNRDLTNTTQLSKTQVVLDASVDMMDRITLPDGSKPEIMAVEGILDEAGNPYLTKVFF